MFGQPTDRAQSAENRAAVDRRDFPDELLDLSSVCRIDVIDEWHQSGLLAPDELRACLVVAWSSVEFPHQYGIESLVRLFEAAGFVIDELGTERPAEQLTVYRGAVEHLRCGMSWTRDLRRAIWFAERFSMLAPIGRVYAAEVQPHHVLGSFNERGEQELVVDPRGLRNLRELKGLVRGEAP